MVFMKVKFGHTKVNTHAEFVDAAKKIVRSISTVYIPASCMMLEPGVIESTLSIKRDFANTTNCENVWEWSTTLKNFFELACDDESFCVRKHCML